MQRYTPNAGHCFTLYTHSGKPVHIYHGDTFQLGINGRLYHYCVLLYTSPYRENSPRTVDHILEASTEQHFTTGRMADNNGR